MEILFYSHPSCSEVIAMKFCTWQDSYAVVACAKSYSHMTTYNGVTQKQIFHRFRINRYIEAILP